MMCRIESVLQYCVAHRRTLIIDTSKSWFKDDLAAYLRITHKNVFQGDSSTMITSLLTDEQRTVYPVQMKGRRSEALPLMVWKARGHMEMDGIVLSIPLDRSYPENVLVYGDCGSNLHINGLIPYLTLSDRVLTLFWDRFRQLPHPYLGVHIRNTDYQSDVDAFLELHRSRLLSQPFFLASDHADTIERIHQAFPLAKTFAAIPRVAPGHNIHESDEAQQLRTTKDDIRAFNDDMMVDFLLLAASDEFVFSSRQSGFSRSVAILHQARPLLQDLLQRRMA